MAEVAGLVLGAVTLLGTFKDCVDLFSYISAARSFGSDYQILNTKLDIEKFLLLQWADRVRLLQPFKYDQRLDDPETNRTVSNILSTIQQLLSHSSDLQERYGLKCVDATETVTSSTISGPQMRKFLEDFKKLKIEKQVSQKETSTGKRLRWAVRDREKFSSLVRELSYFVGRLNAVIPVAANQLSTMIMEDINDIQHLRHVQLLLVAAEGCESAVADLAKKNITLRCQQRVLDRLWYRIIDDRRNNVAVAHLNTFRWALHPSQSDTEKWDNLSEWLRSGSGIYWISGKAGSGKSTLMKYLFEQSETKTLLEKWAGGQRSIMAQFFFWNLGTAEQKTQGGLCRGLLYSVLSADPGLIPRLLPNMWREAERGDKADLHLPPYGEMAESFSILRREAIQVMSCYFIDGLDEYSGNYMDSIDFINSLVSTGNIKVVVSSRPILEC